MFHRLQKFDGPIWGEGWHIVGMLIGLQLGVGLIYSGHANRIIPDFINYVNHDKVGI